MPVATAAFYCDVITRVIFVEGKGGKSVSGSNKETVISLCDIERESGL